MSRVHSPRVCYRLIARRTPLGRGGMIWQTKTPPTTRSKNNCPRARRRPHLSRETPRPREPPPSRLLPASHRREASRAQHRRASLPSQNNQRPAAMMPRPRPNHRPQRRGRPVWRNRAAGQAARILRSHAPVRSQAATPSVAPRALASRPARPAATSPSAGRPRLRGRACSTSASSIRRLPIPCRGAAAAWSVPAAALPAEGVHAAGGIITVAAAPRGSSRDHALPAASRAASRTDRPEEAHLAAAHPAVAILHGHRAAQVGQAALISRMASNRTQGRAAVDLPKAQVLLPPGPARRR